MRESYKTICPVCDKIVMSDEMALTYDCHGIPFRYVCMDCYNKVIEDGEKGYDGEYYTELDECIDYDY